MADSFEKERNFIEKLGMDDKLFDKEFEKIKEIYPMDSSVEVYNFLKDNPGVMVVLNMVESLLKQYVPYSVFHLRLDDDPLFVPQLQLVVEAPWEKFENGFREDIRKIDFAIRPFILEFKLGKEFFIFRSSLRNCS